MRNAREFKSSMLKAGLWEDYEEMCNEHVQFVKEIPEVVFFINNDIRKRFLHLGDGSPLFTKTAGCACTLANLVHGNGRTPSF